MQPQTTQQTPEDNSLYKFSRIQLLGADLDQWMLYAIDKLGDDFKKSPYDSLMSYPQLCEFFLKRYEKV